MSYVIGIDSSTTATKAVVWDREGRAVAEGRSEIGLAIPRPGWHEQDAEDWWRSCATAVTLRNQVAGASEGTIAYTLAAIKDWTFLLGPGWVVGWGNGLILGYLMYRSELVPRQAAWLGLIGGPLIILSGTAVLFSGNDPSDTLRSLQGLATIPEFMWELFLGLYCTFKGFRPSSPILRTDTRDDSPGAAAAITPA